MKEKFLSFVESVKTLWNKTSKKMRVIFLSVTAAILAVSLFVVIMLNNTDYVVLYQGLSTTENAEIIAELQEIGIDVVLDGDKLMVNRDDENAVRMQLAVKGYQGAGFDYSTFENGSSLTATQSEKQQWAVYQLQDRLQAMIETFPEVTTAVVNITMPENNSFVLASQVVEPSATVKLQVKTGRSLTSEQVQAIVNIVRDSVPGLTEERISVADQTGDLLGGLYTGRDAAATKLNLTEQVNDTVRRRVMDMIVPLFGDGKVNVAVNSVLDTDQRVVESLEYTPLDPENPTNNPLDYVETDREKSGGAALASGVPGANDNVNVPEYAGFDAEAEDSDYYYAHEIYDYLVGSVKSQIVSEGLDIVDMTVAVIIDADTLPANQRDQIIDLVATTAGITADKVSVQNMSFNIPEEASPGGLFPFVDGEGGSLPLLPIILLVVAGLILLTMLLLMMRRKQQDRLALEQAEYGDGALVDLMYDEEDEEFEPIDIPETSEQKLKAQIKDLANSDPEIVAQLLKTWLMNA